MEILRGLKAPLWDYQADAYSSGSLAMAILAVPFFSLMGANLMALKMTSLLFSSAAFVLAFFFLKKFFGSKAAYFGGLLLIFPPPSLTQVSLLAMGFHTESIALQLGMLLSFYTFLYRSEEKSYFFLFSFGLFSGFAFCFSYISALTFLSCLAAWPLMSWNTVSARNLVTIGSGLAVGLAPWFFYNLTHPSNGLDFLKELFSRGQTFIPFFHRLIHLITRGTFFSMGFRDAFSIPWQIFAVSFGGISAGIATFFIWKMFKRSPDVFLKILPFLFYGLLFFLAHAWFFKNVASEGDFFTYRYFSPFYFFLHIALAVCLAEIRRGLLLCIPLVLIGFIANTSLLFKEPFGRGFLYKGYSYDPLGVLWGEAPSSPYRSLKELYEVRKTLHPEDQTLFDMGVFQSTRFIKEILPLEKIENRLETFPFAENPAFYEGLGYFFPCEERKNRTPLERILEKIPAPRRGDFFRGFYRADCLETSSIYLEGATSEYREWFYFNFGQLYFLLAENLSAPMKKIYDEMSDGDATWFYRGVGATLALPCCDTTSKSKKEIQAELKSIPSLHQQNVLWGIGWTLRNFFLWDSVRARDWEKTYGLAG